MATARYSDDRTIYDQSPRHSPHNETSGQCRHHDQNAQHASDRPDGQHAQNAKERHDEAGDGEKGGSGGEQKKLEVGFWDPDLKVTRATVYKKWAIMTLLLSTFILAILSLYWAVLFRVEQNMSALVVWVIDFDGQVAPYTSTTPIVGPMIVQVAEALIEPSGSVGWGSLPASSFNYDPIAVRQAIYDEKAWAAVIINANATALLQDAVNSGNVSYDPLGAAQVVYVQARDETTIGNYIMPQLNQFQTEVTSMFGKTWAAQVLQRASTSSSIRTNIQAAPQALSPAIGFSIYNLRPFFPPVATPAITIGLIYLIIISFFSYSFFLPIHNMFEKPDKHAPLRYWKFIVWRWVATHATYFFLSLFYSLISLAFQIPFSTGRMPDTTVSNPTTAYGRGSFPVYWMVNFVGMSALGIACENVAMLVGQPWASLWLIFWVITNVSTSFYSITLAPHFYYWGYAWPLHNIVEASRTILFDIHSKIGLNFGVLFAWVAVNTALFPLCCYFQRWQEEKAKKQQ